MTRKGKWMKGRIEWIDISKGIGIFLVIIGHTYIDPGLRGQIYSFHMPLFFFISGYLFSVKKHPKLNGFVLAKTTSLLLPYLTFSIISIYVGKYLQGQAIDIPVMVKVFFLSRRNDIYFDQPLWFLTSLFTVEIIFYFLLKYIKKSLVILLAAIIMSIFSIWKLDALHATEVLPWSLDQSLYYSFYFALGLAMKNANVLSGDGKKSPILILSSVLYIYFLIDSSMYAQLYQYIAGNSYVPAVLSVFLYNVVWAMIAIFFVLYLSQFLTFSFVRFLGTNSLIFLALHTSLGFSFIQKFADEQISSYVTNPNLLGLLYTIGSMIIVSPAAIILNIFFPFIMGKKYSGKKNKPDQSKVS